MREEINYLMEKYMNKPVDYNWTDEEIIAEYEKYSDKKGISKMFCITMKQVNAILKRTGM